MKYIPRSNAVMTVLRPTPRLIEALVSRPDGPLYRYTEKQYAHQMIHEQRLQITTLYRCREAEELGDERGDPDEGRKLRYEELESVSGPAEFRQMRLLRDFAVLGDKAGIEWRNVSNIEETNVDDCYIFCVSEVRSVKLMEDFGYDACVRIDSPEKFFRALGLALAKDDRIKPGYPPIFGRCVYEERVRDARKNDKTHPVFLKAPKFAHQKEVRGAWIPIEGSPVELVT